MKDITLVFLNGETFYPGHTLYGKVVCRNTNPLDLRSIIVKIVGKGDVNWTEHRTETYTQNGESKTRRVPVHYSNHEEYIRHEIHLFGSGGRSTLEPGERTFDFSFTIPPNVPASFHAAHCKIKYTVKAKIDLPWAFDIESEKDFIVNDFTTPNNFPAAMEGVSAEKSKHVCCCCCRSGPIKARCWLPKRGYHPGESIPFCAEIENLSNQSMDGSYVKFIQTINYHATSKTKSCETVLLNEFRGEFDDEFYWSDFGITVPPVPLSPFRHTRLIDVEYEIKLEVDPGVCLGNLCVKLPIMILSPPLNLTTENQPNLMCNPNQFIAQPAPAVSGSPLPAVPYPGGPVPPPNDGNLPYPIAMPGVGVGFIPPGQTHPGGYAYGLVPTAPMIGDAPITHPPDGSPIVQPPQRGSSCVPVLDSQNSQPPSYEECVLNPPASWESVASPATPNRSQDPPPYTINTSIPYSYTPTVNSMNRGN